MKTLLFYLLVVVAGGVSVVIALTMKISALAEVIFTVGIAVTLTTIIIGGIDLGSWLIQQWVTKRRGVRNAKRWRKGVLAERRHRLNERIARQRDYHAQHS